MNLELTPDSQRSKILQLLQQGKSLTPQDAIVFGCYRLGARVYDLRREGYHIKSIPTYRINQWGHTVRYATYVLEA